MSADSRGGVAGAAGDAATLSGFAHGGHNTVGAFGLLDVLADGDADVMSGHAQGGHNTMTVLVFASGVGHDAIMDFRSGEDHIDLQRFGITDFQELFQTTANGLDIVFSASSTILLHGGSQVASGDFLFS